MEREIKSWIKSFAFAFVLAIIILNFFSFFLVSGDSMLPTLENGDYLVLEKSFLRELEYKRGDIVIFKADIKSSIPSERDLVKRIIATEGDHLVIMDNEIFVNDKKINENYILKKEKYQNIDIYIEKNSYFVMGDNRKISLDSRNSEIGVINKKDILGKVILKMFPFKRFRG